MWLRALTLGATLLAVAAVLGWYVTERDSDRSFVDEVVPIPLVVGQSEGDARAALERVGLRPEITYTRFRATHPRIGEVVFQSGGIASPGDSVTLGVASAKRDRPHGR